MSNALCRHDARLKQQRDKLAAGEYVRCACCGGPIESEADAVEKHGALATASPNGCSEIGAEEAG